MSMDHSVYLDLDLAFTQQNIQSILQKASSLGFVYLVESEDEGLFGLNSDYFSIDQAVVKLLNMSDKMTDYESPFLRVKYYDTDFFLRLYENENKTISMGAAVFGFRWDKQFDRGSSIYTIDFPRYIRLLLDICENIKLLELKTYSDLVEGMHYTDQGCITALIDMGSFEGAFSGSLEGVHGSLRGLLRNGQQSKTTFFNQHTGEKVEPLDQEYYDLLRAGLPADLYAKKDDVIFKLEIKRNAQEYDLISVYPLEPYRMKKGYGNENEKIDVAFYIERLLELCENFAIYELKTFI